MIAIQHEGFPLAARTFSPLLGRIAKRIGLRGSLTVRLAGPAEMRRLNRRYRRQDRATDVLSFSLGERLPGGGLYAGDVLICLPVARRQARENGQSLERELLLLMIHGLLHLRGFDHESDRGGMLKLQRRLFAEFSGKLP
jgi:probable rRNA maturation factor